MESAPNDQPLQQHRTLYQPLVLSWNSVFANKVLVIGSSLCSSASPRPSPLLERLQQAAAARSQTAAQINSNKLYQLFLHQQQYIHRRRCHHL